MPRRLLNQETVEEIHKKVLETLESVGMRFENSKAIELFQKHGARTEGNKVFITPNMVEDALRSFAAYEYAPVTQQRITGQLFFGVPMLLDDDMETYRPVTVADAVKMYKLGETSDLYEGSTIAIVDPHDNDSQDQYVGQMAMLLKHSDKYLTNGLRATALNSRNGDVYSSAYQAIKLVKDFHGINGDDEIMTQIICPKSPFAYDDECLLNINAAVEQGQGVMLCPCSLTNLTGPSTILGINVHDLALSLAGIVYIQLLRPGTTVTLSTCSTPTDMHSIQPAYGTPEATLISIVFYEMCKFYKINCGICALLSDAAKVDYQSGMESIMTTLAPFQLTDIDIAYCYPGLMSAFYCGSFVKAIYDEELMRYVNRLFAGIRQEIDPNLLDSMKSAIDTNTFLIGRTSKEYKKDHYLTRIFSKYGVSLDADPEKTDIHRRALKEIDRRLEMYQLPGRSSEQKRLLQPWLPTQCKY